MEFKDIKTIEELEEFLKIRNLSYAAHHNLVEFNKILSKLTETFKPKFTSIANAH